MLHGSCFNYRLALRSLCCLLFTPPLHRLPGTYRFDFTLQIPSTQTIHNMRPLHHLRQTFRQSQNEKTRHKHVSVPQTHRFHALFSPFHPLKHVFYPFVASAPCSTDVPTCQLLTSKIKNYPDFSYTCQPGSVHFYPSRNPAYFPANTAIQNVHKIHAVHSVPLLNFIFS